MIGRATGEPEAGEGDAARAWPEFAPIPGAVLMPLALIGRSRSQTRRWFDPGQLADLVASIRETGLQQPIEVRPDLRAGHEGRYLITLGERRYRAATEAGLEAIPVIIRPVSEHDALFRGLTENLQRQDLSPEDMIEAIQRALELGYKPPQIAAKIGKSTAYVYRLTSITEDPLLGPRIVGGVLDIGQAIELAPLIEADRRALEDLIGLIQLRARTGDRIGRTELRRRVVEAAERARTRTEAGHRTSHQSAPEPPMPSGSAPAGQAMLSVEVGQGTGHERQLVRPTGFPGVATAPSSPSDRLDSWKRSVPTPAATEDGSGEPIVALISTSRRNAVPAQDRLELTRSGLGEHVPPVEAPVLPSPIATSAVEGRRATVTPAERNAIGMAREEFLSLITLIEKLGANIANPQVQSTLKQMRDKLDACIQK